MFLGPSRAGGSATMAQAQRESPLPTEPLAEGTRVGDAVAMEIEQREIEQAEAAPGSRAIDLTEQMAALLAEIEVTNGGGLHDLEPAAESSPAPEPVSSIEHEPPAAAPTVESLAESPAVSASLGSIPGEMPIGDIVDSGEVRGESQTTLAVELEAALREASESLEQVVPPEDPPAAAEHEPSEGQTPAATDHAAAAPAGDSTVDLNELDALLAQQAEELEQTGREESAAPAAAPAPEVESEQDDDRFSEARLASAESTPPAPPAPDTATAGHSTAHGTTAAPAPAALAFGAAPAAPVPALQTQPKPVAPARRKIVLGPAFSATVKALGLPMAMLPTSARDAVAYLAAVTMFNALAVWGYMLFVYKAPVPPPAQDAPALHAVQPAPDAHADPHAAPGSERHHGSGTAGAHADPSDSHEPAGEPALGADAHAEASGHGGVQEPAPH